MRGLSDLQHKVLLEIYKGGANYVPPPIKSTLQALHDRELILFTVDGKKWRVRKTAVGEEFVALDAAEQTDQKEKKTVGTKRRPPAKAKSHYDSSDAEFVTACGKRDIPDKDFVVTDWAGVTCNLCRQMIPDKVICKINHDTMTKTACINDNHDKSSNHNYVTCKRCHIEMAPEELSHYIKRPSPGTPHTGVCGTKKGRMGFDWDDVTCPGCIRWRTECTPPPAFVMRLAYHLVWHAVLANHNNGTPLIQGGCGLHCSLRSAPEGVCICCALLKYREVTPKSSLDVEQAFADIVGLPYEWVVDFLAGGDGDEPHDTTYQTAWSLGAEIWKSYAKLRR